MVVPDAKERFNEAYNELKWRHIIEKQEDLAALLGTSRPNISAALKGNPTVLTMKFLNRFFEKFKNIFRKEWLLKGEGDMLVDGPKEKEQAIDPSSLVNAIIAAKDETIATLQARIVDLERTIADKETIIKAREARIVALERQLAAANKSDIEHYPFAIGAADDRTNQPVK